MKKDNGPGDHIIYGVYLGDGDIYELSRTNDPKLAVRFAILMAQAHGSHFSVVAEEDGEWFADVDADGLIRVNGDYLQWKLLERDVTLVPWFRV